MAQVWSKPLGTNAIWAVSRREVGQSRPKCNRPDANAATVKVRRKKKPAGKRGRAEPPRASCEFWLDSIAYFLPAGRRLGSAALLPAFTSLFVFSQKRSHEVADEPKASGKELERFSTRGPCRSA